MSSYLQLYQLFLQRKDTDNSRHKVLLSDEESDEEHPLSADNTSTISVGSTNMEHSYMRDTTRPLLSDVNTGLSSARTIIVRRPPQCPSCHVYPLEESEMDESNKVAIPTYNEIAAKESMNECARIAKYVKNHNPDDEEWESRINQIGWSNTQKLLFEKVTHILDNDQLGRLANVGRQNEAMQRRTIVDKSAARMRKALASVAWDGRNIQWLHFLLMENLPSTYMASYLDILQTLKNKLPVLIDRMLFGRPLNVSQELLAPVLKKQWEPAISPKLRNLPQSAVIVALPSLPVSGPIPNRLQKWYQHLATIAQIVQITLPITAESSRQPLEQIAEQIVSLTRVKIQELRNENSQRHIILIGFDAGAAFALQVAMSESIACVICMGFAYNTLHGIRGAPDDRILDIKIPILFVLGQNSTKTSQEEIEGLREKMQSETSLVVVGGADDMLRVPKVRRLIENVTQTMVDTMVIDEVYEYIKKILANPPGPRVPLSVTNLISRTNKTTPVSSSVIQQRKRKPDGTPDTEVTPSKSKYVLHIGRPRTRPLLTSTAGTSPKTVTIGSSSISGNKVQSKNQTSPNTISNDDLNMAMESILNDSEDTNLNTNANSNNMSQDNSAQKMVTNFELVPQMKSTPVKTTLLNPLLKHTSGVTGHESSSTSSIGSKIKMIPSNQFVQLKPSIQSQSKIYTIKTTPIQMQQGSTVGNIVTATANPNTAISGQQQIFTLKAPNGQTTQFVTAAPATAQHKYTVVKNASGGTSLQLTTPTGVMKNATVGGAVSGVAGGSSSNLDISNIIDMPILFADNDGNLTDSVNSGKDGDKTPANSASTKPSGPTSSVGQLIISQKIIKEAIPTSNVASATATASTSMKTGTFLLNKSSGIIQQQQTQPQKIQTLQTNVLGANKTNKVVFINRHTMKPCPANILQRTNISQSFPKYTKVVVTNPKATSATTLVQRPVGTSQISNPINIIPGTPIVSTVKQINLQTLKSAVALTGPTVSSSGNTTGSAIGGTLQSGILNLPTKALQQFKIINANSGATNTTGDKPQIRNIVVKPSSLKQLSPQLKSQLLNRNLTVRKLINVIPAVSSESIESSTATGTVAVSSTTTSTIVSSPSITTTTAIAGASTIVTIPVASTITTKSTETPSMPLSTSTSAAIGGATSGIQSAPKIITLNPVNPSANANANANSAGTKSE